MPEPWDPSLGDGCSVPRWLRLLIPYENDAQRMVCRAHDEAYHAGGSRRLRAIADAQLLLGLLQADMNVEQAERYHAAVRMFGRDHWTGDDAEEAPTPAGVEAP